MHKVRAVAEVTWKPKNFGTTLTSYMHWGDIWYQDNKIELRNLPAHDVVWHMDIKRVKIHV